MIERCCGAVCEITGKGPHWGDVNPDHRGFLMAPDETPTHACEGHEGMTCDPTVKAEPPPKGCLTMRDDERELLRLEGM